MLMHTILQNQLLCAFVANLKIDAIYALYPESFCDKNLAIRKVIAFCDCDCLLAPPGALFQNNMKATCRQFRDNCGTNQNH